jgi:hypothetical protein
VSISSAVNQSPAGSITGVVRQQREPGQNKPASTFGHIVSGKMVGANAKEPNWIQAQLEEFGALMSTTLEVVKVLESRKTFVAKQEYVKKNPNGTLAGGRKSVLPDLPLNEFKIRLRPAKKGDRLPKKMLYSDLVILGKNGDWSLNQWIRTTGVLSNTMTTNYNEGHYANIADQIYKLCPAIAKDLENDLEIPKRAEGWECRNYCQIVLDLEDGGGCLCFCNEHRDECPSHGNPTIPGF